MIQYQALPTLDTDKQSIFIRHQNLPEIAHFDDPAVSVMRDYQVESAYSIPPHESIDHALQELNTQGILVLLVTNSNNEIKGIISIEDILGEKPIKLLGERRISRENITVQMVMTPIKDIVVFDKEAIQSSKVGNIVETLKLNKAHYALVVNHRNNEAQQESIGLFNLSQLQKQLHIKIRANKSESTIADLTKKNK